MNGHSKLARFLSPPLHSNETQRGRPRADPQLRASNEGLPRPRVARAQRIGSAALTFLIRLCLTLFLCLDPSMIGAIHIHRDGQVVKMFFHQRLDVFPVEPAHTSGQA